MSRFERKGRHIEVKVLYVEKRVKKMKPLTKMIQRKSLELFAAKTRWPK